MKVVKGLVVLGLSILLVGCTSTPEVEKVAEQNYVEVFEGTYQEVATYYVEALQAKEYEVLKTHFEYDVVMADDVMLEQVTLMLAMTLESSGDIEEVKPFNEYSQGEYVIVQAPLVCTEENFTLNLVFNNSGEIAGINFVEFIETSISEPIVQAPQNSTLVDLPLVMRDGLELNGVLTLPEWIEPGPVVILVHGSGPNDMNETLYGNTVFRDLAYQLAQEGIATYRYDKRTFVDPNSLNHADATLYDEVINDVEDIYSILKTREDINQEQIYVLGHSLGGMSIPRIAHEIDAAGYVMMAAPASNFYDLMEYQLNYLANFNGENSELQRQLEQVTELAEGETVFGVGASYWNDILSYDQLSEASNISVPVLVLQGEEDYQVPMSEYETWKAIYLENKLWTFISYPGLSHLMMEGNLTKSPDTYYTIKQNVDERIAIDIANFIEANQ